MKSTYKLIGSMWDGLPKDDDSSFLEPFDPSILDASVPYCLFDLSGYKRAVNLTTLLSCDGELQVASILGDVSECSDVYILLDYQPMIDSPVHQEFFNLRFSQIFRFIKFKLPLTSVHIMQAPTMSKAPDD